METVSSIIIHHESNEDITEPHTILLMSEF